MTVCRPALVPRLLALAACALGTAYADHIIRWPGSQASGPQGLFSAWQADQGKVREAIRSQQLRRDRDFLSRLRRRVHADPTRLDGRLALAHALWRSGRVGEAIAQFRIALTLHPASIPGRVALASLYRRCERLEAAVEQLRELVMFHPTRRRARLELASALVEFGRRDEAISTLREFVSIAPDDPEAAAALATLLISAGQADQARLELERAAKADPKAPEPRLLLARVLARQGKAQEARQALSELVSGGYARARLDLALLELRNGRLDQAQEALGPAPKKGQELLSLAAGLVALARGDHDKALAIVNDLRERAGPQTIAPLLLDIWLSKGDRAGIQAACASFGALGAALLPAYEQFLKVCPPKERPRLALHLALAHLCRVADCHDEAIAEAQAARKLVPGNIHLGRMLASCYQEAGRLEDELALRKRLAVANPDVPPLGVDLARCLLRRADYQGAAETCEKVLEGDPKNLEARLMVARLASRRGDYPAAVRNARAAASDHPDWPEVWRLLVSTLVAAGDLDGAATLVRRRPTPDLPLIVGAVGPAIVALADGKPRDALARCAGGLEAVALRPLIHYLAGLACEREGRLADALSHFLDAQWLWRDQLAASLAVARVAGRLGRHDVAATALRQTVAMAPGRLDLRLALADALTRAGRAEEALEVLHAIETHDEKSRLELAVARARALLGAGRLDDALELADRVLAGAPSMRDALGVALEAARRLGATQRALQLLRRVHELVPDAPGGGDLALLLVLSERPRDALARLEREVRVEKPPTVRARLARIAAVATLVAGKREEAAELARRLQKARPTDAAGSPLVALVAAAAGADRTWKGELERLRRSAPWQAKWLRSAVASKRLDTETARLAAAGLLAFSEGWFGRAGGLLERALGRQPEVPFLLAWASRARARAGELTKAIALARKLVAKDPEEPHAKLLLGSFLEAAGKKDEACEHYWSAIPGLRVSDSGMALAAAQCLERQGQVPQAIETYRRILELGPKNPVVCNNLAWLYAQHRPEKLREAEKLAAAAVAALPDTASFHDTLGWLRFLLKDYQGARAEILEALARRPTRGVYFYHLGMVEFAAGRRSAAERALRLALKLEPEMPQAETARATLKVIEDAKLPGS